MSENPWGKIDPCLTERDEYVEKNLPIYMEMLEQAINGGADDAESVVIAPPVPLRASKEGRAEIIRKIRQHYSAVHPDLKVESIPSMSYGAHRVEELQPRAYVFETIRLFVSRPNSRRSCN